MFIALTGLHAAGKSYLSNNICLSMDLIFVQKKS